MYLPCLKAGKESRASRYASYRFLLDYANEAGTGI